jgi:endo-1,4-beta-xylanase
VQQKLAQRYANLFAVFLKHHDSITRVTFWGVTDGNSWLNDYPIRGRTAYPLLFDRAGRPKPAFDAVLKTAQAKPLIKLSQGESASTR